MDPDVAWQEMITAVAKRDAEEARERAEALLDWLSKRGYPPKTASDPKLPQGWHRSLTYFACHWVLAWHKKHDTRKR